MNKSDTLNKRKYFSIWDLCVVLLVVLVATICGIFTAMPAGSDDLVAVICLDGEELSRIRLSDVENPYEITVGEGIEAVLRISADGVEFVSSECPDKLCVNTGFIHKASQSAVCLPARVSVSLISDDASDYSAPDAVVG